MAESPSPYWDGSTVLVTGGSGFLGGRLVSTLREKGARVPITRSKEYDLVKFGDAVRCIGDHRPDIVIHNAAYHGGIMHNARHPGRVHFDNLMMGANVFEACRLAGVRKLVTIGTGCSYPGHIEGPLEETDFWNGACHESAENYGVVKKILALQGKAYKKEYGLDSIHLVLTNLYGEEDSFGSERSHVVPAVIRKFVEAKRAGAPSVVMWGTGNAVRDFLYVGDCAEAISIAAEQYDDTEPLNIGTGAGTSIRELAELIRELSRYPGDIVWDARRPEGATVKILSAEKRRRVLRWEPRTSLRDGLARTIAWYEAEKEEADKKW